MAFDDLTSGFYFIWYGFRFCSFFFSWWRCSLWWLSCACVEENIDYSMTTGFSGRTYRFCKGNFLKVIDIPDPAQTQILHKTTV